MLLNKFKLSFVPKIPLEKRGHRSIALQILRPKNRGQTFHIFYWSQKWGYYDVILFENAKFRSNKCKRIVNLHLLTEFFSILKKSQKQICFFFLYKYFLQIHTASKLPHIFFQTCLPQNCKAPIFVWLLRISV